MSDIYTETEYKPKVSAILPVYNVEDYIGHCIESLQAQTLADLEFIFVDDCSTDGSMATVEAWAAKDERVHILQNEQNLGAGPSRNRGIEVARGEYLSFIDPDDYVSPNFYDLLYKAAIADGGHDITKGLRVEVDASGKESRAKGNEVNARILEKANRLPLYRRFTGGHWTAIYHRHLFEDGSIRYGTARKSEDSTFLLRVCSYTEDIVVEPRAEYHYLKERPDSAIHQVSVQKFYNELDGLKESIEFLKCKGFDKYAYEYLATKLKVHLERYRSAAKFGTELHRMYPQFFDKLISLIEDLPEKKRILKMAPDVQAL